MTMTANLEMAKAAIENNTMITVEIRETWIDFGANWKELQLIGHSEKNDWCGGYQILNPKQVKDANMGLLRMEQLQEVIDKINERGW